jgi:hypothetical protein
MREFLDEIGSTQVKIIAKVSTPFIISATLSLLLLPNVTRTINSAANEVKQQLGGTEVASG